MDINTNTANKKPQQKQNTSNVLNFQDTEAVCSFCGQTANDVEFFITRDTIHICSDCVQSANSMIAERRAGK